ncbi:MAG: cyanophycinase [Sulfobacillus acidophilus]|uniref:Cyanophycinase n=1 Tax=Sulfobacillus acidophilus TaxID=53633 RepID=A0A2T2WIH2_9FIRM|nr:MAG: cyanophycinase [Sulfobacillus acidophilus]
MEGEALGSILVIGGAEERSATGAILGRFLELAQGKLIGVLTGASQEPVAAYQAYQSVFEPYSDTIHLTMREPAEGWGTFLDRLGALFITGGDQGRLADAVRDTALATAISRRVSQDLVVAGTSAGAAVLSERMIRAGNLQDSWTSNSVVQWGQGLHILPDVIVDQHFTQRGRFARLVHAVLTYPDCVGLGVDEDTAVELSPVCGWARIWGRGTATVLRARPNKAQSFYLDVGKNGDEWSWPLLSD